MLPPALIQNLAEPALLATSLWSIAGHHNIINKWEPEAGAAHEQSLTRLVHKTAQLHCIRQWQALMLIVYAQHANVAGFPADALHSIVMTYASSSLHSHHTQIALQLLQQQSNSHDGEEEKEGE